MPTNGMTIDSLNTVSSLTAQDEVPVWDKEASGEPTRKITAQNMTNSVKTLGSLVNTTEMNNAIAQSTALEYITGADLFTVSDSSLVELDASNTRFAKCGRIVYGQVRFSLRRDTSGSTKLFTPKTEALRAKWFPLDATFATNYAVFPVFRAWDAGKIALCFMNDTWDFGIGSTTVGDYIANFTYIART